MRPLSGTTRNVDSDPRFDAKVDELARRLRAGQPVELESLAGGDPEHLEELKRIMPVIQKLSDAGRSLTGDGVGKFERLGDFTVGREIGRGGMGVVYEAMQESLGRRVALKVLPKADAADIRRVQRFQAEAHAAALLSHPNIVRVHAVGCERETNYYAMEFVDGTNLAALIHALRTEGQAEEKAAELASRMATGEFAAPGVGSGHPSSTAVYLGPRERDRPSSEPTGAVARVDPRAAAHLAAQAAEGLAHAHAQGVVHRDIKPANLLLNTTAHLWVTDFGLARVGEGGDLTASGELLGTARYMSPEQVRANRLTADERTDIYSLGITLYELLTLRPAFEGSDSHELLNKIMSVEPVSPRRLDPSIPRDLETIVLKSICKEPEGRYRSAAAMGDDLKRFLEGKPISARRPSPGERVVRWGKRHSFWVGAGLVVACLVALGSTGFGLAMAREQRRTAAAEPKSRAEVIAYRILEIESKERLNGW